MDFVSSIEDSKAWTPAIKNTFIELERPRLRTRTRSSSVPSDVFLCHVVAESADSDFSTDVEMESNAETDYVQTVT